MSITSTPKFCFACGGGVEPGAKPPHVWRQPAFTAVNSPCQIWRSLAREPCTWPEIDTTCGYLFSTRRQASLPHWRLWNVVPAGGRWSNTKTGLPGCVSHARRTAAS